MINKQTLLATSMLLATGQASASTIAFSGEIHTGNSQLSIHNMADPTITISEVTVTLGDNAVFSTSPVPVIDTGITVAHFGADSSVIDDPADYTTATALDTGYLGPLSSDILQAAKVATFRFDDFDSGEAWGISVDYDTADGVEDTPGGNQMNNTRIDVTFIDGNGVTDTLSFLYTIGGGTGKASFPTDPIPFNAESELAAVPVPAAAWLFGSGLIGLITVGRRRTTVS